MKRLLTLCLTVLCTTLVMAAKRPARPSTAGCDTPALATALSPAPAGAATGSMAEARAVWLDRRLIRWPGAGTEGRFKLYRSSRGKLLAKPGERVRGSDGAIQLQMNGAELPAAAVQRLKGLGAGPLLALGAADAASLPALLRDQLLLVREDKQGRVRQATGLQLAGALDSLYAAAAELPDLGLTVAAGRSTNFRLWAPTAQQVSLCLYRSASLPATTRIPLQRDAATGAWALKVGDDLSGGYYTYLVEVAVRGRGVMRHRVTDPYAISLSPDARRAYIANLGAAALKPPGWDASAAPKRLAAATDMVAFELHVRDFLKNDMTVSAARRGRNDAASKAGVGDMKPLRALADAGLTHVQLLTAPDPGRAAKGSQASDGARRILEFRQMVMALHGVGLRVGVDAAYNQPSGPGGGDMAVLDRVVPGYYHRLNASAAVERSTCCEHGATGPMMMVKLMTDVQLRLAREYRVDTSSQRVGEHGAAQIARQAYIQGLPNGESALAPNKARADDLLRTADTVRAGLAGSLRSYVMTTWRDELLPLSKIDHAGQPAIDASQPGEVVNRAGNHDKQTFKLPLAASAGERAQAQHLDAAIVAFSQGIALFHAGAGLPGHRPLTAEMPSADEAFADLLKIRASSSLFRLRTAADVQARLLFHNTGSVQVATVLVGHLDGVGQPGAVFRDIVYLVNVDRVAQTVTVEPLKDRPFELHPVHAAAGAADRLAAAATYDPASGSFTVPARTAVVFVVR